MNAQKSKKIDPWIIGSVFGIIKEKFFQLINIGTKVNDVWIYLFYLKLINFEII